MIDFQYMVGEYDYRIAVLSVVVAILASYTALDLAGRVAAARRRSGYGWLVGGALTMGTGVWSMHFIAMLAFELPIVMGYDFLMTAASWFMAVSASVIALRIISRTRLTARRLLTGAACMAVAIGGMHYTGMHAMRMQPAIVYDPILVLASLLIAFGASAAALWIGFTLRGADAPLGLLRRSGAAVIMGVAIAGMHYTGMAAAQFPVGSVCRAATEMDATWLATLIGVSTILLLGIALISAVLDRRLETQTARLVHSLSQANDELRHLSLHDPLTNLANRALLHERAGASLERWQREGVRFAIVYIDLDGFKAVNDNLGHQAGDNLLRRTAGAIADAVRHGDTVARIGGDEFVLLANDLTSHEAAAAISAKLLSAIAAVNENGVQMTASIGYALCPEDGEQVAALLTAADVAMYAAKAAGKNGQRRYHESMAGTLSEEFVIQTELRGAIRTGQLVVHYQPKYTANRRELIGAEALVRWQHPEKGLIPPDRFIYVAERCGLIVELETCVLESVCSQIRGWLDHGLTVPPVSVNLSAVRIRDQDLPDQVQACLARYGLDSNYLSFEITESLAMEDVLQSTRTLKRFNDMGIQFALDDFGTGHSSLSYLKQLPIAQLKIDRSFITDLTLEESGQSEIVRSIISLAHALKLRVVAEGVETEEQLSCLDRLHCDEVQGYLLSRPVPADAFAALIQPSGPALRIGHGT